MSAQPKSSRNRVVQTGEGKAIQFGFGFPSPASTAPASARKPPAQPATTTNKQVTTLTTPRSKFLPEFLSPKLPEKFETLVV